MQLRLMHIYEATPEFNLQLRNPMWEHRFADVEFYAVQADLYAYHTFRIIKDLSDDESEILFFAEVSTIAKNNIKVNHNKLAVSDIIQYDLTNGLTPEHCESYQTYEEAIAFVTDKGRYPMERTARRR